MKLSKDDLTKQFKSIYCFDPVTSIEIEGKKDSKINIFETSKAINFYRDYQSVYFIKEHIFSGEPEPFTTGILFGEELNKIDINDIKIINYLNKGLVLIIDGIESNGTFVLEKLLYPFDIKLHFDLLLYLFNQEKTNIYTYKSGEIINLRKVFNSLYLNDDLRNILISIDKDKFSNQIDYVVGDFFNKYSSEDIKDKLGNKKYIYLD